MKSDTPRTDALVNNPQGNTLWAMTQHAKELEREVALRVKQLDTHIAEIDRLRAARPEEQREELIEQCAGFPERAAKQYSDQITQSALRLTADHIRGLKSREPQNEGTSK